MNRYPLKLFGITDAISGRVFAFCPLVEVCLENDNSSACWIVKTVRNMERDKDKDEALLCKDWIARRFWRPDILKHVVNCIRAVGFSRTVGADFLE